MLYKHSRICWAFALAFLFSIATAYAGSDIANAGSDMSVCAPSAQLAGNSPVITTGLWSVVSGSGTFDDATSPNAIVSGLAIGENRLVWEFFTGPTLESSDTIIITQATPATITAGPDQNICASTSTLAGSLSKGSGLWTVLSGAATFLDNTSATTSVSGLAPGINQLIWTVTSAGCPPVQDTVIITRTTPATITAGPDQNICASTSTLAGSLSKGSGLWTVLSGAATFLDNTSATTSVSGLAPGINQLIWTVTSAGCPAVLDTVIITRTTPAIITAGPDQNICASTSTLAGSLSKGSGLWTVSSGAATFLDNTSATTSVSGLAPGINQLIWTVTSAGCPPVQDTVIITRTTPATITAGPDQNICASTSTLAGSLSKGSGLWTVLSGAATFLDNTSATTSVSGLAPGINQLIWTVTSAGCPAVLDTVIITRNTPAIITAGPDQNICASTTTLAGSLSKGSGLWTVLSGTATFLDNTSATTSVSGLAPGINQLIWTVTSAGCTPVQDTVIITRTTPATITAGPDQNICASTSTLAGSLSKGSGLWTVLSGSATFLDNTSATTSVSGLAPGINQLIWTVTSAGCPAVRDTVSITVFQNPSVSNAGADQAVCATSATLQGNAPTIGTGLWTVISGTGVFTNASSPTSGVSGLSAGNNTFRWTITNGTCSPSVDDVIINSNTTGVTAAAGDDQTICASSATLNATPAIGGTWSVISGSATFGDASSATSSVTGLAVGLNIFRWTVPGGACGNSTDDVSITVLNPPTTSNAGASQNICSNSTTLQANTPTFGTGLWTVVSGSATFANASNPNTTVSGLSTGNNVLRWTISNGICAPSSNDVFIFVDEAPAQPNAGIDQSTCSSSSIMSATPSSGTWSVVSGSGNFTNLNSGSSLVSGLSVGTNIFRWTVSGGSCGSFFDEVSIIVQQNPTVSNAGPDQQVCATVATLAANSPAIGSGLWSVISGSGTFSNALLPNTSVSGLSVGVNTFRWTISNGSCSPSVDDVIITVQANPLSPNAGPDQVICTSTTQLAATAVTGGLWTRISGSGTIVSPNSENSQITGLSSGVSVFRWTIPGGSCADVFDEVSITVQQNPSTANAGADQQICSTVTPLQGNAPIIGSGLWTIVSGTGVFANAANPTTTVSGLSIGNNLFRWTISNGVCPSSSDDVIVTVENNAVSPNAGPDQTICSSNTQLAATAVSGGAWTRTSGSGSITSPSSANSQITGLLAGVSVFRWTIPGGSCGSVFDEVSITVDANPSVSVAGTNQQICATNTTLTANTPVVGNGTWSVTSGSGTFNNSASAITSVSGLSTGANVLTWTISNGVCPASASSVTITVDQVAATPNAGPDQIICSSGTQMAASSAINGTWTRISGSGTITSPNLSNTTITALNPGTSVFRWTVTNGTCPPVFDEVSITVQATPTVSNAGVDQTICSTTTTLSANTPSVGNGFWTLVSGSGVFADPTNPTTSITGLSVGNNTFRWIITNGVCASSSDDVTITVQPNPVTPNAGVDQTICSNSTTLAATAATGGAWSLISGTGTFANANLATTSVSGLSIGANVFRWTIPGGACAAVFDDVQITVQAAPTTSNAGIDQTICSTTATLQGNTPSIGTGLWTVISGTATIANASSATSSVTGLSVGNNVLRWTISNGVCPGSTDEVTITVQPNPVTPNAGVDQTICSNSATLAATAATGGAWSLISGTGTFANANLATTSVSGLSIGANVFRWTIPGGACAAVFDDVQITVQAAPTTSNAGIDQTICSTTATLQGNTPSIGTGLWTVISGTATFANASSATSSVTGLSVGNNVLRWTISNGVCPGSTDDVTITVQPNPVTPNAGVDQTICSNSATLAATSATGGVWSLVSGTGTFANANLATTSVSGLSIGANVFRWTIPGGACAAVFDDVQITVQAAPTTSNAGIDQTICSTTATLQGNTPSIGTGLWTVISGTATIANASSATSSVTGLSVGNNVLRWTISNGVCPGSTDDVTITVQPNPVTPNAGVDQTICSNSATLAATSATGGVWSLVSGTGTFANANLATTSVSGLSIGANVFRWTIPGGACAAVFDDVQITVQAAPTTSNAGIDQTICSTTATLQGNTPSIGTGLWTVISGTATIANASSATSSVTGLSVGNNVLRWTISNGVCPGSTDEVTITVQPNPVTPNAGVDQTICSNSATLAATAAAGGQWTIISGGGTITSPTLPNSTVTGLSNGPHVFRWTIPGGVCPSVFDDVTITVLANPSTPNAGPDQTVCATSVSLSGNTPSQGSGLWTVVSGSGFFSNATQGNSAVSGLSVGQNIFRWTISNGVCPSLSDDVVITVVSAPVSASAGADQIICGNSTTLAATAPSVGVGTWTLISGSGTFNNPSSFNTNVSGIGNGLNVYRWTVINGSCPAVFDDVSVQSFAAPSVSNAGADQSVCGTTVTLNATAPLVGQGTWSLISGNGIIQSANANQTQVTNLQLGSNVFRYTVSNGVCPPSVDDITITASAAPTANAGADQSVCSTSATLTANLPSGATGLWTLVSGNGAIQSSTQATTQISNLGVGANVFQWTLNNGVCPSVSDQVTITRFVEPTAALAGSDLQTCANSAQLSANTPLVGQGFWSVVSGSGNFSNPNVPNASVSGLAAGNNVLRWTISNGNCPVSSSTVTITVDQNPTSASAGADQAICSTSTLLEAESPAAGTGVWTLVSGSGTIASPQLASSGVSAVGVGNNVFRWTVTNGTCVSFDDVLISRALPPSAANAGADQQLCSTTATLLGNTPAIGTGTWSIVSGEGVILNANSATTSVSDLSVGANVFTWTISNGACPVQEDQITIIRQDAPSAANAGIDQTICANQANLAAVLPQVGTGIWSVVSGTGTLSNALSPGSQVTSLSAGANVFQWTTLNGVCPASSDQVIITRVLPPSLASAGTDASVCGSSYQLQATPATIGTGAWTITSGSGTITSPSLATSNVTALSTGNVQLTWTISNAPCPASSDVVVLSVSSAPPAAFAGVDLQVCGDSIFLAGTAPGTAIANWQFVQGSGEIDAPGNALTAVTALSDGISLIEYSISNGNCYSRDTIQIERFEPLVSVFAGNDTTICDNLFSLNASAPLVGSGVWHALTGSVGFDEPGNPQSLVVLPLGESLLEWTVSNGSCPSLSDTISVTLSEPAEQAVAMDDLSICAELVSLSANAPSSGLGFWDVISQNAEVLDPTNPNTQLVFTEENEVVLQWVVQLGFCSSSDTVTISRPEPPFPVSAGEDQTLCTSQATLQAQALEVGTGIWTSTNGGFFSNPSNPESDFVVPEPGIRQLVWTATNGVCSISDTIYVEFLEQPDANAGPNLFGCENDTLYLQAEFPEVGDSYWVTLTPGATLFEAFSVNSGFVAETPGNYYLLWYIENEMCRDSALLTITIYGNLDNECQGETVEVFIPEGFSPNNDGVYDKFVITHSSSKSVDLKVFDRWGAQVFESTNYQNDWEGTSSIGTLINGNELPEGTYYYLVKIQGEADVRKGYFTLWR